jgi:dimethylamine/trimethylamine dehydrogenase
LEAALSAARRGYEVHLAEATTELGGRVLRESALPGLREWLRVRDWRVGQLNKMTNVRIYRDSPLDAPNILEFGARHVVIATGARWRGDGVGRENGVAIAGFEGAGAGVFTPDDIMEGRMPPGPTVIFDDDHYYMGGVLAEKCVNAGLPVTLVTPAAIPSAWTVNTLEALPIAQRLARLGVNVVPYTNIREFDGHRVLLVSGLTDLVTEREARAVVSVTARLPVAGLYAALEGRAQELADAGIVSLMRVGDCYAPGTIQAAVYSGHKSARELDAVPTSASLIRRELPLGVTA